MAINIFEGARRIALSLGAAAAVITALVALFEQDAHYDAQYSLASPNAPFRKTDVNYCPSGGEMIYFDHETSNGKEISVSLCLESMTFTNKNKEEVELIPYKSDANGMTLGASPYSTEISAYKTQVKKRFTMTATDEEISIREGAKRWRSEFTEFMGYLVVGLVIFSALVWAIGWIVRGFLGIPRGMDKRPDL